MVSISLIPEWFGILFPCLAASVASDATSVAASLASVGTSGAASVGSVGASGAASVASVATSGAASVATGVFETVTSTFVLLHDTGWLEHRGAIYMSTDSMVFCRRRRLCCDNHNIRWW